MSEFAFCFDVEAGRKAEKALKHIATRLRAGLRSDVEAGRKAEKALKRQ